MKWKSAAGLNLNKIAAQLGKSQKLITDYIPGKGFCYAVVRQQSYKKK